MGLFGFHLDLCVQLTLFIQYHCLRQEKPYADVFSL